MQSKTKVAIDGTWVRHDESLMVVSKTEATESIGGAGCLAGHPELGCFVQLSLRLSPALSGTVLVGTVSKVKAYETPTKYLVNPQSKKLLADGVPSIGSRSYFEATEKGLLVETTVLPMPDEFPLGIYWCQIGPQSQLIRQASYC